jgi:hypothetical protein
LLSDDQSLTCGQLHEDGKLDVTGRFRLASSSLDGNSRGRIAGLSALRRLPKAEDVASIVKYLPGEGAGHHRHSAVLTGDAVNTA